MNPLVRVQAKYDAEGHRRVALRACVKDTHQAT